MLRIKFSARSVKHSIQSSDTHARDRARQAEFRQKNKGIKWVAVQVDEPEAEKFGSDISALGQGRNFVIGPDGEPVVTPPQEWEEKTVELGQTADFYHRPMTRPNGDIYWRKEKIDGGDLEYGVVELRPDHSRALEYILKDKAIEGEAVQKALEGILAKKIELFEEIYGRRVMFVSEHCDSKHYHHDLWHLGLEPQEVEGKDGKKEKIVLRNPMREYSVGPGTARYFRHQEALAESGVDPKKFLGITSDVIEQNIAVAKEQNGENPREIRFMQGLDTFVRQTLRSISPKAYERGHKDYVEYLKDAYPRGEIGARRIQKREARQIEELETEVGKLQKLLKLAVSLFNAVLKVPAFLEAVKKLNLYEKLVEFGKAVGIQLAPKEPVKGRSRTRTRERRKTKEKAKEPEMEKPKKSRRIKPPEEPTSPGIA